MNREIEREPKCMIKDPNSGKFIACDPEMMIIKIELNNMMEC